MVESLEQKSKSQLKREMLALQSLGEQLVELPPTQISKIEMPEDLREAVLFAQTLKRSEARRRQLQYIGTLMREGDPEPIRKALDEIARGRSLEASQVRQIEQWRTSLLEGKEGLLDDILARFPEADRRQLRQLVVNARKEQEGNKPPKTFRALFRYLRELTANKT
jgi:ribosome-associated protein